MGNASIPGKAPRKADSELTPEELARRNRRRMRNREAATRQRDRRLGKVAGLENEIKELREQGNGLKSENEKLKEEIEQHQFQFPPQLQRLNSHSSMSEFSEFVAVL